MQRSRLNQESIVVVCIVLLLIIAGLWDKQISQSVIDQGSVLGTFFQNYCLVVPFTLMFMAAQVFAYVAIKSELSLFPKVVIISFAAIFGFFQLWKMVTIALYYTISLIHNLQTNQLIGVANSDGTGTLTIPAWHDPALLFITLAFFVLGCLLCRRWLAKKNLAEMQSLLFIAFGAVVAVYGTSIILGEMKAIWGRMRPYEVMHDWSLFTSWFQINGHTGHKSFPSGHSMEAWLALYFTFFVDRQKIKQRHIVTLCAIIFACLMGIMRVRIGAHFLGDVTMGATISIFVVYCVSRLLNQDFSGQQIYPVKNYTPPK